MTTVTEHLHGTHIRFAILCLPQCEEGIKRASKKEKRKGQEEQRARELTRKEGMEVHDGWESMETTNK